MPTQQADKNAMPSVVLTAKLLPHQNRETKNIFTDFKCLNLGFLLKAGHITGTDTKKRMILNRLLLTLKLTKK